MTTVSRKELGWAAFMGTVLVGSAFMLVQLHCQARQLYVEHEHELDIHRRLLDDKADLEMKVRRASLPGNIGAGAAMLDLEGVTAVNTVTLVEQADGSIDFLPETRRQLDEFLAAEAGDDADGKGERK
ncbi:hypothetical protein [Sutterella sp.]|uniref:hypothetical protein n=1 Tax=Sutterella sp. TaxID=1981025 RepID=UPI0026DF5718|nr:hypothetical protein [Sutterella sp.]MDO5530842.1 hypothetical protein [Sutterella sp.]